MTDVMRATICIPGLAMIALGLMLAADVRAAGDFDVRAWVDEQVAGTDTLSISAAWIAGGDVETFHAGRVRPAGEAVVDADTRYQIGSLTKAFTHLLLAEMAARGEVGYDTPLADLVGDRVEFANPAVGKITLLELATHTSGLPRLPANLSMSESAGPYADYDGDDLLAAIGGARAEQPLGDHYAYSNFGAGLLGYLLGRVHGGGYERALAERVLSPLGLAATEFDPDDNRAAGYSDGEVVPDWTFDALAGAGALWSNTEDLVRLARIQLGVEANPLDHSLEVDREVVEPEAGGYAVTRVWHVAESPEGPVYWHNGGTGGFGSFFGFRPATGEAVILLVAGKADPTRAGMQWLQAGGPGESSLMDIDESVTGQYELSGGIGIGVFERDGRLVAQLSGQAAHPITDVGNDWYTLDVADASLRFLREGSEVVAVELVQNGVVQRAGRVAGTAEATTRTEVSLDREALREYVGEYAVNPNAKFTIRLGDERLEAKLTGQSFLPIFAKGDDVFFYKAVDAELHFERGDQGELEALVLHQGGIHQRAERVD